MPRAPARLCSYPGCMIPTTQGKCDKHLTAKRDRNRNERRPSAGQRGYGWQWQKARRLFLNDNPLCAECMRAGRTVAAKVVDHIEPHRGDAIKFWDCGNWASMCVRCHNIKTGRGR